MGMGTARGSLTLHFTFDFKTSFEQFLNLENTMGNPVLMETRNVDLAANDRKSVAGELDGILKATYELLLATQLVHWNAKGPTFYSLHKLTEEQYDALFETLDILAERIRALGAMVPVKGATSEFTVSMRMKSDELTKMVDQLVSLHEKSAVEARRVAENAEEVDDVGTADMLVDCIKFHEKSSWMLRALNS
jgi:starvation-inducible DNA-binding protein